MANGSSVRFADRLKRLAVMAVVFHKSPRARLLWDQHHSHALGEFPATYVFATAGISDLEGLVIRGDWDPRYGWDYDSRFRLLTEDGEILSVNGWMASSIQEL